MRYSPLLGTIFMLICTGCAGKPSSNVLLPIVSMSTHLPPKKAVKDQKFKLEWCNQDYPWGDELDSQEIGAIDEMVKLVQKKYQTDYLIDVNFKKDYFFGDQCYLMEGFTSKVL